MDVNLRSIGASGEGFTLMMSYTLRGLRPRESWSTEYDMLSILHSFNKLCIRVKSEYKQIER